MEKYRSNCFWYTPWKDMSATIHQCYLAETAECPCTADCEWFIETSKVRALIYEKQMKDKERRDSKMPLEF